MIKRVTIALLLLASAVSADEGPLTLANVLEEGKPPFREELREAARISGAVLVGVQAMPRSDPGTTFGAFIPEAWKGGEICARVVSVDGLYEAVNTYTVAGEWTGGTVEVPYPTQYPDRLRDADAYGLAMRLSHGACDAGSAQVATIAFREADDAEPLTLLVNSFRSDMVVLYVGGDSTAPVVCAPVSLPGRTAYDTFCEISDLPDETQMTIEIVRMKNRSATSERAVTIMLPGG